MQISLKDLINLTKLHERRCLVLNSAMLYYYGFVINLKAAATESFAEQAKVTNDTNFFATLDACQVLFPLLRPHARLANL